LRCAEPRAILLLDGRNRRAVIYLKPLLSTDLSSKFGAGMITPGDEAARIIGLDAALTRDQFSADLVKAMAPQNGKRPAIYTPFRPEVLSESSSSDVVLLNRMNLSDPWDGRISHEAAFREHVSAATGAEMRDLDPILDQMRSIKTPREIELIREATQITADGIQRAMQLTKPGMTEYQLQAETEYIFKRRGSYGTSYFALVAAGQNTWYTHYHRDTATLKDGDIVQLDDAPDFKGYTSDLSRVFPANGHWTQLQRERYTLYLACYRALLASIQPHKSARDILANASTKIDALIASHHFTDDATGQATRKAFETYAAAVHATLNSGRPVLGLGHSVGMEVHDVNGDPTLHDVLQPGIVFTIEPAIRFEDDHTGMRIEDMIVITESGVDILSKDLPEDPDAIEKLMHSPLPSADRHRP
jgi:Xaa-Pro aminopeptidase